MADPQKPGYRTSEFWLALAAMLLSALFASGAIPTDGPANAVAGIVASVLTALGYTVTRTGIKAAAARGNATEALTATATVTKE